MKRFKKLNIFSIKNCLFSCEKYVEHFSKYDVEIHEFISTLFYGYLYIYHKIVHGNSTWTSQTEVFIVTKTH